jgi:hypothetical protein
MAIGPALIFLFTFFILKHHKLHSVLIPKAQKIKCAIRDKEKSKIKVSNHYQFNPERKSGCYFG